MIKYELKEATKEIKRKDRLQICQGVTIEEEYSSLIKVIKAFKKKEDAIEQLLKYETEINDFSTEYSVTEFYVEENEYDEDGEFVKCNGIHDISEMRIDVVDKETYIAIATYDNFRDAEYHESDNETYLSFI